MTILFRYSTKKLFIDDDIRQLHSLMAATEKRIQPCEYHNDVKRASNVLKLNRDSFNYANNLERNYFKKGSLTKIISDDKKCQQISVIIADYKLNTGITGLDFLTSVCDKSVYRILYTGVADEKIAIRAFNQGLIDGYFKKSDKVENLLDMIEHGELAFFKRKSQCLENIMYQTRLEHIFLHEEFKVLFDEIVSSKRIIEFYILDECGSYIMFSPNKIYTLLVMPFESIPGQIEVLKENNMHTLIEDVFAQKKMLYLVPNWIDEGDTQSLIFKVHGTSTSGKFIYSLTEGDPLQVSRKRDFN